MAFDPSIEKKLKELEAVLAKLKADTAAVATDLTKNAAQAAANALKNALNTGAFRDMLSNSMSKAAQASAKKFAQEFQKQTASTLASLGKITAAIANIQDRTQRVAERMARGFNDVHRSALMVKRAVEDIDKQLAINTRMAKRLGASLAHEMASNPGSAKALRLERELAELKSSRKYLNQVKASAEQLPRAEHQLGVREKAADIMDRVLGPVDKARAATHMGIDLVKYAGVDKFFGLIAVLGIVFKLISAIFGQMRDSVKVSREAGLTYSQSMHMLSAGAEVGYKALKNGVVLSLEEATQYANALGKQLGSIFANTDLGAAAATYGKTFNVGPEEMARLTAMVYRMNGRNVVETVQMVAKMGNIAVENGAYAADIFRTMVQHSEDFAKQGNISAAAFARAAVHAQQLGVDLGKFSGLADTLVSDFEGGLRTQATLQTFFPGMDLSKVMYASQFGNEEQIQQSIVQAIRGTGQSFQTLPRSFKLAMARSFGMSVEDIGNIAAGGKIEDKRTQMKVDFKEIIKTSATDALLGGLAGIQQTLTSILSIISVHGLLNGGITSGVSSAVTNTNAFLTGMNAMLPSWMHFHAGGVVSGPFAGAPRYHFGTGLGPDEVPAILQSGEQVLSRSQVAAGGANMTAVVSLLQQILIATKEGHTIELDGTKVGRAIVDSHNRGM